jgi:hypothetical protein
MSRGPCTSARRGGGSFRSGGFVLRKSAPDYRVGRCAYGSSLALARAGAFRGSRLLDDRRARWRARRARARLARRDVAVVRGEWGGLGGCRAFGGDTIQRWLPNDPVTFGHVSPAEWAVRPGGGMGEMGASPLAA